MSAAVASALAVARRLRARYARLPARGPLTVCVTAGAISVIPLAFPAFDPFVSALFWNETEGGFSLCVSSFLDKMHRLSKVTAFVVGVAFVVMLGLAVYARAQRAASVARPMPAPALRALCLAAAVWLAGPGLIINGALKSFWGRARPLQTERFGGDKHYSAPWRISDQCESNCSFSSGDPSVGCALAAFGLFDRRRRRAWFMASLATGGAFGVARVAMGKHYLSDVAATFAICYGLHAWALLRVQADERSATR